MKPVFIIGLLLCFLAGCRPSLSEETVTSFQDPSPLVAVDSLMWGQPDSAFALLQEHFDPDSPYAQLLLSELLYKNNCTQNNRSELLRIVDRFDSTPFLSARAHYINGVGYYENDSVVEACREYLKALEIMENHYRERELVGHKAKFMALTHTHLLQLFSDQFLHEQAVFFGKNSLRYYDRCVAPSWYSAWVLEDIGSHFDMVGQLDSADYYYHCAKALLCDSSVLIYRDLLAHCTFLSYEKGEDSQEVLSALSELLEQSQSEEEYLSRCLIKGVVFYHERLLDSTQYYWNKVFESTNDIISKKYVAERLVEICKDKGMDADAFEYAVFLVPFSNQEEEMHGSIKSCLSELYNTYKVDLLKRDQQQRKMKSIRWGILIVGSLVVLLMVFTLLNHKNIKRKNNLKVQIEEERYVHRIQRMALSSKLTKRNVALREALGQLKENNRDNGDVISASPSDFISFVESPICRHILKTVQTHVFKSKVKHEEYQAYALHREQVLALRKAADEHMNLFTSRLKEYYPKLNYDDVTCCCLYLLGLNDPEISALMQKAYSTVCERKRKITGMIAKQGDLSTILRNI